LIERLKQAAAGAIERGRGFSDFRNRLRQQRSPATWILMGVCAVMMALAYLWGGPDLIPVMVRMGASVPDLTLGGEWYRPVSAMFLHGNFNHILMNMVVLLVLGGFLEKLLGARRFLVLYALAGLAGGLASTLLSQGGYSVGASGALWGLLGASGMLAFRPAGLVPEVLLPRLKRSAVINLVLNAAVSFLPHVDWYAHLGGGVVGILLIGSGLLTRELKTTPQTAPKGPDWALPAAVLAAAFLAAGPIWAVGAGRPWELTQPISWQRTTVPEAGVSLELPAGLLARQAREPKAGLVRVQIGDLTFDPMQVDVAGMAAQEADLAETERQARALLETSIPKEATSSEPISERRVGEWKILERTFLFPSLLRQRTLMLISSEAQAIVTVLFWEGMSQNSMENLRHVVDSIRPARVESSGGD
jgi:rhomboid protease GluP